MHHICIQFGQLNPECCLECSFSFLEKGFRKSSPGFPLRSWSHLGKSRQTCWRSQIQSCSYGSPLFGSALEYSTLSDVGSLYFVTPIHQRSWVDPKLQRMPLISLHYCIQRALMSWLPLIDSGSIGTQFSYWKHWPLKSNILVIQNQSNLVCFGSGYSACPFLLSWYQICPLECWMLQSRVAYESARFHWRWTWFCEV